jgi:hypothetical protein
MPDPPATAEKLTSPTTPPSRRSTHSPTPTRPPETSPREVAEASGDRALALNHHREALAAGEQLHLARLQRTSQAKITALTDEPI